MVFHKIIYGANKQKIKDLLRLRLKCKDKIRHHERKIAEMELKIKETEEETNRLIDLAKK